MFHCLFSSIVGLNMFESVSLYFTPSFVKQVCLCGKCLGCKNVWVVRETRTSSIEVCVGRYLVSTVKSEQDQHAVSLTVFQNKLKCRVGLRIWRVPARNA